MQTLSPPESKKFCPGPPISTEFLVPGWAARGRGSRLRGSALRAPRAPRALGLVLGCREARSLRLRFPRPARPASRRGRAAYRGPLPLDAPGLAGVGSQLLEAQGRWEGREGRVLEERPGLQPLVPQRRVVLAEVLEGPLVRAQPLGRLPVLRQLECDARHGRPGARAAAQRASVGLSGCSARRSAGARSGFGARQRDCERPPRAMIHPAGQRPPRLGAWPGRSRPARRRALDPAGRRPAQRRREDGGGGPRGRCCHLRPAPGMAEPARAAHLGVLVEKWGLKLNPDRRLPTCWGGRLGETRGWGCPDSPEHTLNILT
ncbi:uncharacterized protein LOC130704587 [Balaenoptera acutorostrata]|uniref:Uncharacterized protein LOC130704587 n=1 Tax=Balaenoptera acutorostrata TaxID=9767 RepID=A0ABM3RX65_BALAC|nr:uncharacterized protein LOC130704587 [Balaenoptera acutorostrata]